MTLPVQWQSFLTGCRIPQPTCDGKSQRRRARPLRIEALEARQLMAVVPDESFGIHGVAHVAFSGGSNVQDSVLQADGKLVVVGVQGDGGRGGIGSSLAIARFNKDGTPDTSFSRDGKTTIDFQADSGATAVAVQPDGKIVVGGYSYLEGFVVARLRANGKLDPTFSKDGKASAFFFPATLHDIAVQSDGKILAVGTASGKNGSDFAVVRFNSDGKLDRSFGNKGQVLTSLGKSSDIAYAVHTLSNGQFLVAGSTLVQRSGTKFDNDYAVVKYNADGSLDRFFGDQGKVISKVGKADDTAHGIEVLPDGRFVVAGTSVGKNGSDFSLVRYLPNGMIDVSFGTQGTVITNLGGNDEGLAIQRQSDNKLLVSGSSRQAGNGNMAVARYMSNGDLDPSFGKQGKFVVDLGTYETAPALAVVNTRKFILAGETAGQFVAVRFIARQPKKTSSLLSVPTTPTDLPASDYEPAEPQTDLAWTVAADAAWEDELEDWLPDLADNGEGWTT